VITEERSQLVVEQVRGGMVAHDIHAALGIDAGDGWVA
jgi:hypothetical protein